MCGIAGIYNYSEKNKEVKSQILQKMVEVLSHRGPDGKGYYINGNVGLGHCRLAVIDLVTGDQPIYNETKEIALICNGEIYNFMELKKNLENNGKHKFYTHSDTEVIVHLYEEYGIDFINKLDGMFAFALWDNREKMLLLARDYFGKKPIYYYNDGEKILFASELKSILKHPGLERNIDFQSLYYYLSFLNIPYPFTIFKGIYKLAPAHYLYCNKNGITINKYWDLPKEIIPCNINIKNIEENLNNLLTEAVKKRLISDVPLGAFLSGGIDSSTVVSKMCKLSNSKIKTFSIVFKKFTYYNEEFYVNKVRHYFNTEHYSFDVDFNLVDDLPKIIWHCDEPFAVSSCLPLYYLSKMARKYVKVVLTGDGGDEVFAGYSNRYYSELLFHKFFDKFPLLKNNFLSNYLKKTILFFPIKYRRKILKFLDMFSYKDIDYRYLRATMFFTPSMLSIFLKDNMDKISDLNYKHLKNFYQEYKAVDYINRRLYGDIKTSLCNEMLTKIDSMTMAHSLEARSPLLDKNLVSFIMQLPSYLKINFKGTKYIFKKTLQGSLPKEIIYRKKHGFEVPVDEWIRKELRDYIQEWLSKDNINKHKYFDYSYIKFLLNAHLNKKFNFGHEIWSLLIFQIWYNIFMEQWEN